MRYRLAYVAVVVAVNLLFTFAPFIDLPWGGRWNVGALAVGAAFVVRDWAQREAGRRVTSWLVAGGVVTALFNLQLALVSGFAFLVSEALDQEVFTQVERRRSFRAAVLASQAVGITVDSAIFLWGTGRLSPAAFATMVASKAVAALWVLR